MKKKLDDNKTVILANSMQEYLDSTGISSHNLGLIHKFSPLHYLSKQEEVKSYEKAHNRVGTAIHSCVLEPEKFEEIYIRANKKLDRRLKSSSDKAYNLEDWNALTDGGKYTIISATEYDICKKIRDRAYKNLLIRQIIESCKDHVEESFYAPHPATGLLLKARPDMVLSPPFNCVLDLKSTKSAHPKSFAKDVVKYSYPFQLIYHSRVVRLVKGPHFNQPPYIIAVEKEPPYDVQLFRIDDRAMIAYADYKIDHALLTLAECLENQNFPGYEVYLDDTPFHSIKAPTWMQNKVLSPTNV